MKLRARLVVTVLIVSLPAVAALSLLGQSLRRRALLETVYETTVAQMEGGARERCEAAPDRFGAWRGERRSRRAARARRIYDDGYQPTGRAKPLEPALRRELEAGEPVAAEWLGERRVRVAMRMPWDGPCAIVVVERPTGPLADRGEALRTLLWSSLVAVLTALAALFAMGPVVRRLRALSAAVRAQATGGYASDVPATGRDEITDLARSFNEASREIRRRLEEVSSRDRALTEFLQSTTHDVMVPLTVLSGHLSDLSRAAREGQASDSEKIALALEEAHYLGSLLRNLSAAARLQAGEPMLARHRFDLRALIERVASRHQPVARERGVELAHAIPEAEIAVVADSTLVEQAVSNLVHNAIRYNQRGGHVALVLEEESEGRFAIRVVDDGPGIPAEELAHVSERRFRGGAARARNPTGLGLGLHIVRDVAERHDWTLRFESPPEGGLQVVLVGKRAEDSAPIINPAIPRAPKPVPG